MNTKVSCRVTCGVRDELNSLAQLAQNEVSLDRVMARVTRAFPNGIEVTLLSEHRLGDYFKEIDVQPEPDPSAFRLEFYPRPDADRYWKDIIVRILQSIQSARERVTVSIDRVEQNERLETADSI
jgi:hypothetical protein